MTREQQFAEHLANGLSIDQIQQIMGYATRRAAAAQLHRIRRKLGPQAR